MAIAPCKILVFVVFCGCFILLSVDWELESKSGCSNKKLVFMERGGGEHAVEITSFRAAAIEAVLRGRRYMVETTANKARVLYEMLIRWQLLFVVQDMTTLY